MPPAAHVDSEVASEKTAVAAPASLDTVKVYVVAVVAANGVPEIRPVPASKVKPLGSAG